MKEVDREVGVMRENICWYCRTLRMTGRLYNAGKKVCAVTGRYVTAWTTNSNLIPPDPQLKIEFK